MSPPSLTTYNHQHHHHSQLYKKVRVVVVITVVRVANVIVIGVFGGRDVGSDGCFKDRSSD